MFGHGLIFLALLIWFFILGIMGANLVFWVLAIVDIAKTDDRQWVASGQSKVLWLLLVIFVPLCNWIYWFYIRTRLREGYAMAGPYWHLGGWQPGQVMSPVSPPTPPPVWHPDPLGRHGLRYWDGTKWSEHVSDNGQVGKDPLF